MQYGIIREGLCTHRTIVSPIVFVGSSDMAIYILTEALILFLCISRCWQIPQLILNHHPYPGIHIWLVIPVMHQFSALLQFPEKLACNGLHLLVVRFGERLVRGDEQINDSQLLF